MFWPMVLWTYLFFFVKLAAGTLANNPVSFAEFPAVPIPGQLHLWFLWALLIISVLLLPLRFCLNDGHLNPWVLWGLGGVIIILANMPMPFALHYWTSNALQYLPFFYLGVVLSHENAFDRLSRNAGLIAAGVFISMIAVWPLIKDAGIAWPASFVVTLCFLVAIAKLSEKYAFWGKGLALNLGKATFAIYVAHTIFSATMREVLFVASVNNVVMHMLVGTLIGIIGPLIFVKIAKLTKTRAFFGV